MSRLWNETVGFLADHLRGGMPMLAILSVLATVLISVAWYFWPSWLPWHWRLGVGARDSDHNSGDRTPRLRFRFGRLRWRWRLRWRRRRRGTPAETTTPELPDDELPDLPAADMILSADQLAAAGRYKEAVRERMRAIVRDLVDRGVIAISPGWTVTELANSATRARPELTPPLGRATATFSEIWYGLRPARAEDDEILRGAARDTTAALLTPAGSTGGGA